MKIGIGTLNAAKRAAVQHAWTKNIDQPIEFIQMDVPSLVSAQPLSDEETVKGAINRSRAVIAQSDCEVGIGLEGGVKWVGDQLYLCNWGALITQRGDVFTASGAGVPLPTEIEVGIKDGIELGPLMDAYTNRQGIRHNEGAIGVFTNGLITRSDMFEHIVVQLIGQWQRNNSVV